MQGKIIYRTNKEDYAANHEKIKQKNLTCIDEGATPNQINGIPLIQNYTHWKLFEVQAKQDVIRKQRASKINKR